MHTYIHTYIHTSQQACNSREMFDKYNKVYGEKEKFMPVDPGREREMTAKAFLGMMEYLQVDFLACVHADFDIWVFLCVFLRIYVCICSHILACGSV
jgi:hypothetical protein